MKDGLRFVDSDMHVMEPPDLFDHYLDPAVKHRVSVPVGADGRPCRGPAGLTLVDGLPTADSDLQQYRKRVRRGPTQSTQPLSGSRLADTGRLDFAVERDYDPEAQVMGMEMEGVDIAVLYPTSGLSLIARDNLDPRLSLALCQAYNNWIHDFCRHSPDRLKFVVMLPVHDVHLRITRISIPTSPTWRTTSSRIFPGSSRPRSCGGELISTASPRLSFSEPTRRRPPRPRHARREPDDRRHCHVPAAHQT